MILWGEFPSAEASGSPVELDERVWLYQLVQLAENMLLQPGWPAPAAQEQVFTSMTYNTCHMAGHL
jgi:hypothetical protein